MVNLAKAYQAAGKRELALHTASNKPDEVKKWRAERVKYPPAEEGRAAAKGEEVNAGRTAWGWRKWRPWRRRNHGSRKD